MVFEHTLFLEQSLVLFLHLHLLLPLYNIFADKNNVSIQV